MATSTVKVKYGDTLSGIAKANNTSVAAIMAANPSIKDPNKIYAGSSLSITPSTPVSPTAKATTTAKVAAPVPMTSATPPAQTIAERASMVPDLPKTDSALQAYYDEQARMLSTPIDERKIRDEIRNNYNSQFESLRLAAAQKKAEIYKEGENRLGSARATQARSGVLGSNFASAEDDQINKDSVEQARMVDAETDAKIAFLMGQSEQDYSAQIAAAREAKRAGADEYIKFLQTRDSQRTEQVSKLAKLFAAQGIDPKTLSAADVTKLEKTYGVNLDQLNGLITEEKNKINKDAFFELSDGQSRYEYDPATGTAKLIAENTKNFAPNKYSAGGSSSAGGSKGTGGSSTSVAYDDPNYLTSVINASKGGRLLTQSEADPLTKMKRVVGQAETISSLVQNTNTGPILGIIRSNNPYDTKAQLLRSQVTALVPQLARGVYGEVGVLTDSDVDRYTKTIASLKNTADVNKAVMAMTLDIASKSMAAQLESMAAAGRDVSGYANMYKDTTNRVNKLKSELTATTAAPAAGPSASDVKVKAKDGRVITIPQTNLSSALKNGYVQVK